ncbi:MAG TPA: hypothetical protein VFN48_01035 [Solirubrobacteraceae bacterium]|nr:hypothetical protein [Solirubrobacteraceae bacterium]
MNPPDQVAAADPEAAPAPISPYGVPWTVRGLAASHPRGTIVCVVLLALTIGYFAIIAAGPRAGAIADHSTCEQWGSANVDRQHAYAALFLAEHHRVSPKWGPGTVGVINAINAGCYQAYGEDVANTATMLQAVTRGF